MRLIGKARRMRRVREVTAVDDFADRTPQALPDAKAPERHADFIGKEMLEARRGETDATRRALGAGIQPGLYIEILERVRDARIHDAACTRRGMGEQIVKRLGCPRGPVTSFINFAQVRRRANSPPPARPKFRKPA